MDDFSARNLAVERNSAIPFRLSTNGSRSGGHYKFSFRALFAQP